MNGVEFAILYTLQHRLTRDTQELSRFLHRHIAVRGLRDKAIAQFLGGSDLPRRTGRKLFDGHEPIVQPSVQRRRRDV